MPRQPYPIVAGPESEPHEPDEQRALAERRDEQLADTGIHVALYGFQCKRRHVLRQQEGREHVRMAATRDPAYLAVGLRRLANDLRSLCVLAHSTQVPATCGVSDGEQNALDGRDWVYIGDRGTNPMSTRVMNTGTAAKAVKYRHPSVGRIAHATAPQDTHTHTATSSLWQPWYTFARTEAHVPPASSTLPVHHQYSYICFHPSQRRPDA